MQIEFLLTTFSSSISALVEKELFDSSSGATDCLPSLVVLEV